MLEKGPIKKRKYQKSGWCCFCYNNIDKMRKKFCPRCGREESEDNPLIDEFCKKCSNMSLIEEYKDPKVRICTNCGSYYSRNSLLPALDDDFEENISKIIEEMLIPKLKFNSSAEIRRVETEVELPDKFTPAPKNNPRININLFVSGIYNKKILKEKKTISLKINFMLCKRCSLKDSKYYEAILQIRPNSENVIRFVNGVIDQRKDVFITKEDRLKEGTDLYITSQRYTRSLISRLKEKFGGEVTITKKLYSQRKDGKKLYRSTFLFRLSKPL